MASAPPRPAPGASRAATEPRGLDPTEALRAQVKSAERARIAQALAECGGNQTQAAILLGISRRTLVTRLSELDLPRPRRSRD
jgi:DNA-binding NtrC family response regulator